MAETLSLLEFRGCLSIISRLFWQNPSLLLKSGALIVTPASAVGCAVVRSCVSQVGAARLLLGVLGIKRAAKLIQFNINYSV